MSIVRRKMSRKTTEEWAALNPILQDGELGWDKTLNQVKIGNGVATWDELSFVIPSSDGSPVSASAPGYTTARFRLNPDYHVNLRGYEETLNPANLEVISNFDLEFTQPLQAELTPPATLWVSNGDTSFFELSEDETALYILRPGFLSVTFIVDTQVSDSDLGEEDADGWLNIAVMVIRSRADGGFAPIATDTTRYTKPPGIGEGGTQVILSTSAWLGEEHFYTDAENFQVKPTVSFYVYRALGTVGYYKVNQADINLELFEYL